MSVFSAGNDAQALVIKHDIKPEVLRAAAKEIQKRRAGRGLVSFATFGVTGVIAGAVIAPISSIPVFIGLATTLVPAVFESARIELTNWNERFNRLHRDKAVVLEAVRRHIPDAQPAPQALTAA